LLSDLDVLTDERSERDNGLVEANRSIGSQHDTVHFRLLADPDGARHVERPAVAAVCT
jgi:hypothetical protein